MYKIAIATLSSLESYELGSKECMIIMCLLPEEILFSTNMMLRCGDNAVGCVASYSMTHLQDLNFF
jgi:hypothetical protein